MESPTSSLPTKNSHQNELRSYLFFWSIKAFILNDCHIDQAIFVQRLHIRWYIRGGGQQRYIYEYDKLKWYYCHNPKNLSNVTLNNIIRSQKVSISPIFVIFKRLATKVPYIRIVKLILALVILVLYTLVKLILALAKFVWYNKRTSQKL